MTFEPFQSPYWPRGDTEEVSAQTVMPFELQELKDYLKISNNEYDLQLQRSLRSALRSVQKETGRAITTWSLRLHLDGFPSVISLPYPHLQGKTSAGISSITYVDTNGVTQTLSSSIYEVWATEQLTRVSVAYGESWPSTRTKFGAVRVNYTAGYADADDVPEDFKTAIKWKVHLDLQDQLSGTVARELRDGYDRIIGGLLIRSVA